MSLNDREILELNELCNALADGTITGSQKDLLARRLAASEEARRFYIRVMGLCASLHYYASEMQSEAADALPPANISRLLGWRVFSLALAALVVLALWIAPTPKRAHPATDGKVDTSVARLTGSRECQWLEPTRSLRSGSRLNPGVKLELGAGFAEITFDSGAQIVLEGPASCEVNSAWDVTLRRGTLKANVPPEALGFRVSNPAVKVMDLGTEFTMIADGAGAADVLVLKGEVEADPSASDDQETIVLKANESRRFASSGVSEVRDSDEKFARFIHVVPLDHFAPATHYVHWSFDEPTGTVAAADDFQSPLQGFEARLQGGSSAASNAAHSSGHFGHALRFDGNLFAKAPFPNISGNSARTVLFWVKVPEEAQLSDAYAMVAWATRSKKLGAHPVHIGWNRNPAEGTLGVLRTDYGGGYALGATPLRDGHWHFVAVIFAPGEEDNTQVAVKQYIDGRLEGEGHPSPLGNGENTAKFNEAGAVNVRDILWLGCRLGSSGQRMDRLRGELDELTIADRALEPREIVALMKDNRPASATQTLARNQ